VTAAKQQTDETCSEPSRERFSTLPNHRRP